MAANLPQGSGFSNIQRIIQANQQNNLGNTVQSGVQQGVNNLNSNVSQAQGQFQSDVNNATLGTDANKQYVSGTIGGIANAAPVAFAPPPPPPQAQVPATPGPGPGVQTNNMSLAGSGNALSTGAPQTPLSNNAVPKTPATQQPSALSATPSMADTTKPPAAASTTPTASASTSSSAPGSFGFSEPTSGANQTVMTGQGFNAPSAGDINKFGTLIQGGYGGPQQLQNYQSLVGQGQQLQNIGSNVNTQGGLQSLLQRYVGGNKYNQGEQNLDTLLLGQTGKQQLKNVAQSTQNIANKPLQAEAQAEGLASSTAAQNKAFGEDVKNQLTSAQNPILQTIQNNLGTVGTQNAAYQKQAQDVYNLLSKDETGLTTPQKNSQAIQAITQAAQNGMLSNGQLDALTQLIPKINAAGGDLESAFKQAFNFNPQMQTPNYSLQQGATGQQAAQLNALGQLAQNGGQFGTYGGMALPNYGFDLSKLAGFKDLSQAQQSAAAQKDPGFLYDMLSSYVGLPVAAGQGLLTGGQTALHGDTSGLADIAKGNPIKGGQEIVATPGQALNAGMNQFQLGLNQSIANLNRAIPGSATAANTLSSFYTTPLNNIRGLVDNVSSGGSKALGDLAHGNIGSVYNDAGNTIDTARLNAINQIKNIGQNIGTSAGTAAHDVGSAASHAAGQGARAVGIPDSRFFCTELYKRHLATFPELIEMSKFLLSALFKQTKMVLFYAQNGEAIVTAANKANFNWPSVKYKLIDNVVGLMNSGKIDESHTAYSLMIKEMCLKFPETSGLWNDSYMSTTWYETILTLPKVIQTRTFKMACKIYLSSKFYSVKGKLWQT